MGLFGGFRGRKRRGAQAAGPDLGYLEQWAGQRSGVEAYVEPQTRVTPLTVVLVAADGEWTRRPVGDAAGARRVGERLAIPVYDVQKVGYPQRMRDFDAQRRR
ncbi:MAG: oxidoreductase [Mycobacterium sp.]